MNSVGFGAFAWDAFSMCELISVVIAMQVILGYYFYVEFLMADGMQVFGCAGFVNWKLSEGSFLFYS